MLILSNGKRAAQGAGTARFFRTLLMRVQIVKSVTGKDLAFFLLRYFFSFFYTFDIRCSFLKIALPNFVCSRGGLLIIYNPISSPDPCSPPLKLLLVEVSEKND